MKEATQCFLLASGLCIVSAQAAIVNIYEKNFSAGTSVINVKNNMHSLYSGEHKDDCSDNFSIFSVSVPPFSQASTSLSDAYFLRQH